MTNGDAIVPEIEAVAPDDPVLPWRDILHEGPVPGGIDDAMLRAERAAFVAREGWGDGVIMLELFERRDQKLLRAADELDLWLWFEDDLFDGYKVVVQNPRTGARLQTLLTNTLTGNTYELAVPVDGVLSTSGGATESYHLQAPIQYYGYTETHYCLEVCVMTAQDRFGDTFGT